MSPTAASNWPVASRPLLNSPGASGSCLTVSPSLVQSRATATAVPKAAGFEASSGLSSSIEIGVATPGRCQPSAADVQPALSRAALAASGS